MKQINFDLLENDKQKKKDAKISREIERMIKMNETMPPMGE